MTLQIRIERLRYLLAVRDSLRDILIELDGGDFVQVCGSSGSGKTTLCHAVTGIVPQFFAARLEGNILLSNERVNRMDSRERMRAFGLVTEDPLSMLSQVTTSVQDEIALRLYGLHIPFSEIQTRIDIALTMLGLTHIKMQSPETLSGGQQVRLALAAIAAIQPLVYVIDDGLGHLDREAMIDFFDLLARESREGKIVIFVSNDLLLGVRYANKVIVLDEGKMILRGTVRDAVVDPNVRKIVRENPFYECFRKIKLRTPRQNLPHQNPVSLEELVAAMRDNENEH